MLVDPPLKHAGNNPIASPASTLADFYAGGSAKIRQQYETTGDGRTAALERSALMDSIVAQLYRDFMSALPGAPEGFCLVALGGYGRQELFPHSDIDVLFLSGTGRTQGSGRGAVAAIARALWDLRLRVGHTVRTLEECGRLHRDNLEFNISLLDCRYLAGDAQLFGRLHDQVIPHLVRRDRRDLVRDLVEMTRRRHSKYGDTIFHLEPNLREAPGGLRDYHVTRWLTLISELDQEGRWVTPEEHWPAALGAEGRDAFEFLSTARCFLHYQQGRDDNHLTYEVQEQAASQGIGHRPGARLAATDWMRTYFRHARSIDRLTAQLLEEVTPARASLYGLFQDWKSRLGNADFSVVRGRIFPRRPAAGVDDPGLLLSLFEMVARHGLELSREAERLVEEALPRIAASAPRFPGLWRALRQILVLPHAAEALRALHRLRLLVTLFPEFSAIDGLVIRDFFHRYTVDEHSFRTIQNVHELRAAGASRQWEQRFCEIFSELEQPELLFLTLLYHDVGKGMPASDHVWGSLEAVEGVFARLGLEPEDRETVRFLIAQHLEMSATLQRRDVFDAETIRAFAEKIKTAERLKMLCLLTFADIEAVNPEALTPWKAEMLWQLYAATSNYLTRSLDEDRVHAAEGKIPLVERLLPLLPESSTAKELSAFLEGFPSRYPATHSPEEMASHYQMARELAREPVQVSLRAREHFYELTVLTADRPFLFASLTGTLAAWGMNIVKADAFANQAGIVLDTFRFVDLFRTLELNPSETVRLKESVVAVLSARESLETVMNGRINSRTLPRIKVRIRTQIRFDDACSSHSTLLELVTQDRPGLLYQVSAILAELGCNIEVALIDTEGQKVIDAFYLTSGGAKLDAAKRQTIRDTLLRSLS